MSSSEMMMQDDSSSSSDLEQEDLDRLPRSQDSDFDHEIDESDSADGAEVLDEAEEDDSEEEAESGVPVDSCFIPDRPIPRRSRYRLHELCGAGLIEDIKQYLSNEHISMYLGTALNRRDTDGCTPLHHAVLNAQLESLRLLLAAGADPRVRCESSALLHMAVAVGSLPPFPHTESLAFAEQAVTLLRDHPVFPADLSVRDDHGRTPGLLAAQLGLPSLFRLTVPEDPENLLFHRRLSEGSGAPDLVSVTDIHGNTHLHLAAQHHRGKEDLELLRYILALSGIQGAPLQNRQGDTPLHTAVFHNNSAAAHLFLLESSRLGGLDTRDLLRSRNLLGLTPKQLAERRGFPELAAALAASEASLERDGNRGKNGKAGGGDGGGGSDSQLQTAWQRAEAGSRAFRERQPQTLVICDERGEEHYTYPDPIRPSSEPPSENMRRLLVLTHPSYGVLRGGVFQNSLGWKEEARRADIVDILRVHEYTYVRKLDEFCRRIPDTPRAIRNLDPDTSISSRSLEAALRAAGASCEAVDRIMLQDHSSSSDSHGGGGGGIRNVFCAVRPPGHHAGPYGIVTSPHDPHGTHGFCLLNNVAIAAAYARAVYRNRGIRRVAILDFDVHHGNGTEAIVRNVQPSQVTHVLKTPFLEGEVSSLTYKPWLNQDDKDEIFFASVHGYGRKDPHYNAYFYPGSGRSNCEIPDPPSMESGEMQEHSPEQDASPPAPEAEPPLNSVDEGDILPPPGIDRQERLRDVSRTDFQPHLHHTHHRRVRDFLAAGKDPGLEREEKGMEDDPTTTTTTSSSSSSKSRMRMGMSDDPSRDDADFPSGPPSWIFNLGLPVIDPDNTLTEGRREWRKAWRDRVLSQLYHFKPDFIFISAGFDGHRKDSINFGYLSLREDDYYWLTRQIAIAANTLCGGRLVSVLEGGYKVEGRVVSAFGRSVAEHVRALTETLPGEVFRAEDWKAERLDELREERRLAEEALERVRAAQEEEEAEHRAFLARLQALQERDASTGVQEPQEKVKEGDSEGNGEGGGGGGGEAEEGIQITVSSRGRRRRGPPVDYAKLNEEMNQELQRKKRKLAEQEEEE